MSTRVLIVRLHAEETWQLMGQSGKSFHKKFIPFRNTAFAILPEGHDIHCRFHHYFLRKRFTSSQAIIWMSDACRSGWATVPMMAT